jgi:hypothetical protein
VSQGGVVVLSTEPFFYRKPLLVSNRTNSVYGCFAFERGLTG